MTMKEDDFDVEHDLKELERLLEESNFEEKKRLSKEAPQHGQNSSHIVTEKKLTT